MPLLFARFGQRTDAGDLFVRGGAGANRVRGVGVHAVVVSAAGHDQAVLRGQLFQLGFILLRVAGVVDLTPSNRPAAISSRAKGMLW